MRVIAIVVAVVLGAGASAYADRIDDARDRVLTREYQPALPSDDAGGSASAAGSGSAAARADRKRVVRVDTRGQRAQQPAPVAPLMTFFLWGLIIVVVALAVIWIGRDLLKYGNDDAELPPDGAKAASDAESAAIIERPLGDADELARRGSFAEAIHALLLRTLQELVRSAAVRVERSHTSREILARVPLLADSRDALAGLITAVELTHFGDEPANAADYDRCREQFHRFATAFRATGLARRGAA